MLLSKKSNTLSKNTSSRQIALLLPLSGPLGGSGNAVRNGFFAAYYQMKASQNNAPTILVFNTYGKNIIQVYQQALQQGADFIVGPLTKTSLQTLADSRVIKVPTLALNNITDKHAVANPRLFQFGLSPNDEAQQIAQKAWNEHHRRALVIAPANAWGQGIAQVFMNQWQSLGGQVVGIMRYSSLAALPGQIQNLLKVDQSQQKLSQLKQILGEKLRSTPTHRQDADMIFLLAQPNMARQINPLIKYYYGGDLPIYATSEIYTGLPNSIRDRDLDGIIFCDMPWTLNPNHLQPTYLNTIQQNIKQLWLSSYNRYIKLYALGIDAYRLVNKLNNPTLSALGVNGASGKLYLLNNQQIYRSLQWAKMQHGIPVVLNN